MRRRVHRKAGLKEGEYLSAQAGLSAFSAEKASSQKIFEMDMKRIDDLYSEVGDSLAVTSTILRRAESSKELERGMENLGKDAYDKLADKDKAGVPWEKLSQVQKAKYMPITTYGTGNILEKLAVISGVREPIYEFKGKKYSKSKLQTLIEIEEAKTLWQETR